MDTNDEIIKRRNAISALESSVRKSQMAQMQSSQLQQMQDSQRQLMQMQQELARSQEQAKFNLFGTGASIRSQFSQATAPGAGWSTNQAGNPTQSFGGLVGTGLVKPLIQSATFGLLYPAAGFQMGSSADREIARARDEIGFRMRTSTGNAVMQALMPQALLSRSSNFAGIVAGEDIQRNLRGRFESLRGADRDALAASGGALPGDFGVRLNTASMRSNTAGVASAINRIRDRFGSGSISDSEVSELGELSNTLLSQSEFVSASRQGGAGVGARQGEIVTAISALTSALNANVTQTGELLKEYKGALGGASIGNRTLQVATAAAAAGTTSTGLSVYDTAKFVGLPGAQRGLSLGYGAGAGATQAINRFDQTIADYQSGIISSTQLGRFGGGTEAEAGIRRSNYMQEMSTGIARRTSGFFGVLRGGYASNNLADTYARVGQAYMDNPYAGLAAAQDPGRMMLGEQTAMFNSFTTANQIAEMRGAPEEGAISIFQGMIGEANPVQARNEYRSLRKRAERIRPMLGGMGLDAGDLGSLMQLDSAARSAGKDPFKKGNLSIADLYSTLGGEGSTAADIRMATALAAGADSGMTTALGMMKKYDESGDNLMGSDIESITRGLYESGVLTSRQASKIGKASLGKSSGFGGEARDANNIWFNKETGTFMDASSNAGFGAVSGVGNALSVDARGRARRAIAKAIGGDQEFSGSAFGRFMQNAPGDYRSILSRLSSLSGPSLSDSDLDLLTNLDSSSDPDQLNQATNILNNAFSDRERSVLRTWMHSQGNALNFGKVETNDGSSQERALWIRKADSSKL
jgi:hypothetical protein